jgi:hypothetical protein
MRPYLLGLVYYYWPAFLRMLSKYPSAIVGATVVNLIYISMLILNRKEINKYLRIRINPAGKAS